MIECSRRTTSKEVGTCNLFDKLYTFNSVLDRSFLLSSDCPELEYECSLTSADRNGPVRYLELNTG